MELKINRNTDRSLKRNGGNVTEGENIKESFRENLRGLLIGPCDVAVFSLVKGKYNFHPTFLYIIYIIFVLAINSLTAIDGVSFSSRCV